MPDRDVRTVRDEIFFQYAKIAARSAFDCVDSEEAKKKHYGFIKNTFRDLQAGRKTWSDILREDWLLVDSDKKCIYCGSTHNLSREHIVPKSLHIKPECKKCETIQGIHNQVWACKNCNSKKGTKGLYEFYSELYPDDDKSFDRIPRILEGKYLKTIFKCHQCAGTLDAGDLDGDGKVRVWELDDVVRRFVS